MLKDIFKAYDIRGIYEKDLTLEVAEKIGRAFVEYINKPKIVVGRDMRDSSNPIFDSLCKGITEQGGTVYDIGLSSTPMFYFAVNHLKADGGIIITASHNPSEYNGFKLVRQKAIPLTYNEGIGQIEAAVFSNEFVNPMKVGEIIKKDVFHQYLNFVLSLAKNVPKLKVVADISNGMAGHTAPALFENLDMDITFINKELDGNFPNHEANPLKHDLFTQLKEKVIEVGADFGCMFDGDADRVGFCDEQGKVIPCDMITALIAKTMGPNERVLYDLRSSWAVKEEIKQGSNEPIISRVGHSFIKSIMREYDVVFGGELSGHYYFKDHFYTESSILALIKVAQIVSNEKKTLSEIIKPIQRYYQSGETNSTVDDPDSKMQELKEIYKDGKITELDGISIEYDTWWFNVRKSNTEPLLRLNLEAKDKSEMESKKKEVLDLIRMS
jgi:phosphomannomutase